MKLLLVLGFLVLVDIPEEQLIVLCFDRTVFFEFNTGFLNEIELALLDEFAFLLQRGERCNIFFLFDSLFTKRPSTSSTLWKKVGAVAK